MNCVYCHLIYSDYFLLLLSFKNFYKLIFVNDKCCSFTFTVGQKMVEWNQLDVASFLEQASGFLAEHGQLDGPSCHAPPAKRARSVGLSSHVSAFILLFFCSNKSLSFLSGTLLEVPLSQLFISCRTAQYLDIFS